MLFYMLKLEFNINWSLLRASNDVLQKIWFFSMNVIGYVLIVPYSYYAKHSINIHFNDIQLKNVR